MAYLEAKNLVKRFGSFTVVNEVSFAAATGEFVTLLGPSGCGKTTLLKIIGGFYRPDCGELSIAGKPMKNIPPEQRDTAMCFQSYALFPHLSVFRNVAFGLEQHKVSKEQTAARVKVALQQVDMLGQASKLPSQLSGGQQQRVALARAMALRPGIILFDEPLSNLDAKLRESVRFEIRKLQEEMQFTAVYVTHDQSEALALSDKILVMNRGKVEQEGTPYQIYNHPRNRLVAGFIGKANIMRGRISSQDGWNYQVVTEMGSLKVVSERAPVAEHVYLGWRPENIHATAGSESLDNQTVVVVEQTAFLGNCIYVQARSKRQRPIYLETPQHLQLKKQDRFRFSIQPERIFFLEECEAVNEKGEPL